MDLKDILAALERVRGVLSDPPDLRSSSASPFDTLEAFPTHRRTFLRLSDPWIRPPGLLSSSASPFDTLLMHAEWAFGKSVEDFGATEWRAVAMFLGSVIDNPRKRRRKPPKSFREDLVSNKPPLGRPVKYNESYCRLMVQAIDAVKAEMPGLRTDTAAIKELFKRQGRRRSTADAANLGRRLSEWRRQFPGK